MSDNFAEYFICPHCNGTEFEEQQEMVTFEATVVELLEDGTLYYKDMSVEDGYTNYFKCSKCSEEVIGKNGKPIISAEKLITWIKEGCKKYILDPTPENLKGDDAEYTGEEWVDEDDDLNPQRVQHIMGEYHGTEFDV